MTLVNIDLRNVAGETGRHDQVVFHAPVHREGSAGQTIQTAPVIVDLEGGIGSVDLDPGPVVVDIRARGWEDTAPKTVMVPEEGPITLTGLLLDAFEWAPVVVSEVRALASRAESAADRAEDVADTFGSLEGVAVSVQAAEAAATSATGSASAAALSATAANDSEVSAASSAAAAAQSAVNAANSEWVAGEHRGAAEAASDAASVSASDAAASAGAAANDRGAAEASASAAADSAANADNAATRAENVVDTVHWQGDQLSVMGKVSPPLAGDDGATPYVGAGGTWWVGDTDTGVRAQGEKGDPGDGAGDVLWSDLDPILDGKAAVSHDHTIGQVAGLQDELDGKAAADHQHSWGDVTDKPSAYPPESHTHPSTDISDSTSTGRSVLTAASQAAARQALGAGTSNLALGTTSSTAAKGDHTHSQYATTTTVNALSAQVDNRRGVIHSGPGPVPSGTIPGAVVGDYWLNETTMELSKITAV